MTENDFTIIITINSNDKYYLPFVFSLPVFLLTLSVCCFCIEVEEVKRRQHCLMFSSAGSQAQTYFVNFDTLADYQRWHRQASKVSKRHSGCVTAHYVSPPSFLSAAICLFPVCPSGLVLKSGIRC